MTRESLRQRSHLSRALHDIDMRIHSNLDPREILQTALEGFVAALEADAGDIKLIDGDEWVVSYETGFGPEAAGLRLAAADAPIAERVAHTRAPVLLEDYFAQDDIPCVGFPKLYGLRSVMAVPLIVRDAVIGSLFAWMRSEPRTYTMEEVEFAQRMAASVSLALENARLFSSEQGARKLAERAEKKLRRELDTTKILLRASDEFSSTTDTDELLERLAQVLLDATGINRVFINRIEWAEQVLIPKIATGGLVAPAGPRIPFSELTGPARSAIEAKRVAVLDYEAADLCERDRAIARANQARVVLFVPLLHRSEIIGHIALDEPGERASFTRKQMRVVQSIAAQASLALQNARQLEREHRIAETLQQALLLPPERVEGLEVAVLYQAASAASRVGGDIYDVFSLDENHVALVVGDVSGKGIGAAPLTAMLRDGVRAYLLQSRDPGRCLARLNALLHRFTPESKFATAFLGVLDKTTGELDYCCAAHPPAIILTKGRARVVDCKIAALIGAFPDVQFHTQRTTLKRGDVIVVVTDGVTEARREGRLLGDEGLREMVEELRETPVADLPDALLDAVVEYSQGHLRDDVVILCVSIPE